MDDPALASHFIVLRVNLRGTGHTFRQAYLVWQQGAPPRHVQRWGGGGKKGWAPKPNDVERLHAPATRQWAQD